MPEIKLFQIGPSRSLRAVWALNEAGLEYESEGSGPEIFASPELKAIHPLSKVPAIIVDGKPLFESAAICTYIADLVPEKNLVAKCGTYDRALHNQWTAFVLSEMEAWLWSTAINSFLLPEDQRNPTVHEQNHAQFRRGASALNDVLANQDYLVGDRFSVTDIIAGFAINWGRRSGWTTGLDNLHNYLQRLFKREHCSLDQSDKT